MVGKPTIRVCKIYKQLDFNVDIIGIKLNNKELETLKEIKELKIIEKDKVHMIAFPKTLDEHFKDTGSIEERNKVMVKAIDDGYTQIALAKYLNLSRSLVSKVLKELL